MLEGLDLYVASGETTSQQWAVANLTCQEAQQNITGYACASMNSMCLGVNSATRYVGYRCKCIAGFYGNPYIADGWQGTLCLILKLSYALSNIHNSLCYGDAILNGRSYTFSESDSTKKQSQRQKFIDMQASAQCCLYAHLL
jgi:hypothetical protein